MTSLTQICSKRYISKSKHNSYKKIAQNSHESFKTNKDELNNFYLPTRDYIHPTKCVLENGWVVEKSYVENNKDLKLLQTNKNTNNSSIYENDFHPSKFQDKNNSNIKFKHGTTTLGFMFDGGVIIAVDSRASMGSYIGSGTVKKIIEINPYLLGTMAGGAADCAFWERQLSRQCRIYELRNGERITVAAASKILQGYVNQYKGYGLSIGAMVAGWDKRGPQLYYVDNDAMRLRAEYGFSVGSGSTYAYGVLDTEYRKDLTVEQAIQLGRKAIFHATHRDAYSGGYINVYHIHEKGWTNISHDDCFDLWQKYYPLRYQNLVKVENEEETDDDDDDEQKDDDGDQQMEDKNN